MVLIGRFNNVAICSLVMHLDKFACLGTKEDVRA
jgi:hypothetical protein